MNKEEKPEWVVHAFNDLHGRLFDWIGEEVRPVFGRMEAVVRDSRVRWPDVPHLWVGAGDDHAGGAAFDAGWGDPMAKDLAYGCYEEAGVDAITLGNHDLDLGEEVLAAKLRSVPGLSVLVANVVAGGKLAAVTRPSRVFERGGKRVGVIGVMGRRQVLSVVTGELVLDEPVAAAVKEARRLAANCEALVVLSHLGSYPGGGTVKGEAEERTDEDLVDALCEAVALPVLVVGGHTHRVTPKPGELVRSRVGYVQAGRDGRSMATARLMEAEWEVEVRNLFEEEGGNQVEGEREGKRERWRKRGERWALAEWRERSREWGTVRVEGVGLEEENLARDRHVGHSAHMSFLCEKTADVWRAGRANGGSGERRNDPGVVEVVALCARTLTGRLGGAMDLTAWYRALGYADVLAWVDIPWESVPAFLGAMVRRLELPVGYLEEAGLLHFDQRLTYSLEPDGQGGRRVTAIFYEGRPYQRNDYRFLRLVGVAYLAAGFGGYDEVWRRAGLVLGEGPRWFGRESWRDWLAVGIRGGGRDCEKGRKFGEDLSGGPS